MKKTITTDIDTDNLQHLGDEYLAALWFVAQTQINTFEDKDAGHLVDHIGREIIQRWMRGVPVPVWNVQSHHHYWEQLCRFARWNGNDWEAAPITGVSDSQPTMPAAV